MGEECSSIFWGVNFCISSERLDGEECLSIFWGGILHCYHLHSELQWADCCSKHTETAWQTWYSLFHARLMPPQWLIILGPESNGIEWQWIIRDRVVSSAIHCVVISIFVFEMLYRQLYCKQKNVDENVIAMWRHIRSTFAAGSGILFHWSQYLTLPSSKFVRWLTVPFFLIKRMKIS